MSTEVESSARAEASTPELEELSVVDTKMAKDTVSQITALYTRLNVNSYPDHYMYISDIYKYSLQGYDQLMESVAAIKVNSDIQPSIVQLEERVKEIKFQLETETDSAKILALKQQLRQYAGVRGDSVKELVTRINTEMYNLMKAKRAIQHVDFANLLTKSRSRLERRIASLDTNIAEATQKICEATERKISLENSLATLRQNTVQRISVTIHDYQDISNIGIPEAQIQDVQTTLEIFRSNPDLGDVLDERQLMRAVDFHLGTIEDYTQDRNTYTEDKQKLDTKLQDLLTMTTIADIRGQLTHQMDQLLQALDIYRNRLQLLAETVDDWDQLAQLMKTMKTYLDV